MNSGLSTDKINTRLIEILKKINYASIGMLATGTLAIALGIFLYAISENKQEIEGFLASDAVAGVIIVSLGFLSFLKTRSLRNNNDFSAKDIRTITILSFGVSFVGMLIATPLLYLAPIWGVILAWMSASILINVVSLRISLWKKDGAVRNPKFGVYLSAFLKFLFLFGLVAGILFAGIWILFAIGPLWAIAIILLLRK